MMNDPLSPETAPSLSRRLFLKRAGQACGILVFLPAVKHLGGELFASTRSNGDTQYFEHTVVAMGTTARVGIYAAGREEADAIINEVLKELKHLERLFSLYDPASDVTRLNESAGGPAIVVAPETVEILGAAKEYAKLTHRAFDVTIEPVMKLWGFRSNSKDLASLPSEKEVNQALQYVGSDQIEINAPNHSVRLHGHGTRIDLGGIAVGYALDRMAALLRQRGVERAFIDISGDIIALGAPDGAGWPVAIPDPTHTEKIIYHTTIKDEALATSGNYMSYVVYNAIKYGHIMDPHEARPARRVLSSTVIAKRGLDADALSTASFVTGQRYGDTKVVIVDSLGKIEQS